MAEEKITEKKEKRERPINAVIARRYPELYEKLSQLGGDVLDRMAELAEWALNVKEYSMVVTPQELSKITPEALNVALKFVLFYHDQYLRLASSVNTQAISNIYALVANMLSTLSQYYQGLPSQQIAQSSTQPQIPTPIPRYYYPGVDQTKAIETIMRVLELFTMGREDIRKQLAKDIALELLNLSKQETKEQSK